MAFDSVTERTPPPAPRRPPVPVKILVAGGFGVGKTTAVTTISEIAPLTTEAEMTSLSADDGSLVPDKTTTTVAMDFGRITIDESVKLYVFGTPGQDRFGFMWDDLSRGALGALVIVDARRLEDCHAAVDYFESQGLPFVVAVNQFDGSLARDLDTVRWALAIDDTVPVIAFDARRFLSVRDAILMVLERALARATARRAAHLARLAASAAPEAAIPAPAAPAAAAAAPVAPVAPDPMIDR